MASSSNSTAQQTPSRTGSLARSGFLHVPGFLTAGEQADLLELARGICAQAPLRRPTMPTGQPLRLRVTSCGQLGWWADARGYRYVATQPGTDKPWPAIPEVLLSHARVAMQVASVLAFRIDSCLINHYAPGGGLGLHVDRTEQDRKAPIISLSIGADAEFVLEEPEDHDLDAHLPRKHTFVLRSGDLVVQGGASRSWTHGITKIFPTLPNLCKNGSRLNFTLRKVTLP